LELFSLNVAHVAVVQSVLGNSQAIVQESNGDNKAPNTYQNNAGSLKERAFQPGEEKRRARVKTRCIGSVDWFGLGTFSYLTQSCKITF
jgi:hypothetical protein